MTLIGLDADIPIELARRAHSGTSFVPEQRAATEQHGYVTTLSNDYANLEKHADTDDKRATLAEEFARYRTGYRARYLAYLGSRARCMSSMITGPSKFPTARNAKRNAHADKKCTDLVEYRERALDAIRKALHPELRPIMAGDSDALARLKEKIASAKALQERMKACNAAIRTNASGGATAQITALVALGLTEARARELLLPDFGSARIGFPSYQLTNNNADIRRLEARLTKIAKDQATESTTFDGDRARLEDCPSDNRVRLFFPGKPDVDTRTRLKRAGFRWAPSLGCWQAYRNHASITVARREANDPEPTSIESALAAW